MERALFLTEVHKAMGPGLGDMNVKYGRVPATPFVQAGSFGGQQTGLSFRDVESFGSKALDGALFMDVRSF